MTNEQLLAEIARKKPIGFWDFRTKINPKMKDGWWQRQIAEELEQFYRDYKAGLRPKLVICSPPQHGKSIQVIDFLAWALGVNPDFKIIYTSFSERLGVRANNKIKKILRSSVYQELFPKTTITIPLTQEIIGINDEGYFRNTTCGGAITGESLTWGVIDDPIRGRADANSALIREKVWDWFTDDFSTRFSDDGALLCILTRWHIDDPIGRLLKLDPSVKLVSYPALAIVDEPHRKQGEPLFPEHKSKKFLESIKARMSTASWESLYQQNPTIALGNMFRPDIMPVIDAIPIRCQIVRAWDLASTANGGDYTVGLKFAKAPDGSFIVLDVVRIQGGPDEVEKTILNTANRDGQLCKIFIPQDPGQAGKTQILYFTRLLAGFSVLSKTMSGDKVTRAEPVTSQCNVGNVSLFRAGWNDRFIEELRLFPNGINDDQVDALSDAFDVFMGNVEPATDGYQSASTNFFNASRSRSL